MNIKQNQKGFTLVEIVIVLAIAALILAAILIAVQGAQQSRRDAARRDAGGQIGALVEEYAGNHNGDYPTTHDEMATQIASRTQAPGGGEFDVPTGAVGTNVLTCDGTHADDAVFIDVSGRDWQVCVGLESGDWFRASNRDN